MRLAAVVGVLATLALASPAQGAISPGLTGISRSYDVYLYECLTLIDAETGEIVSDTCRTVRWCKGTAGKFYDCLRIAPWTRGTRTSGQLR